MTRRAILYLGAIFLLGVIVGALGGHLLERHWNWGRRSWRDQRARVVDRFTRELQLSSAQREQLTRMLDETGEQYRKLNEQVRPQYDAIRQGARARIRGILTAEQRAKFEELVKKFDEERRTSERHR